MLTTRYSGSHGNPDSVRRFSKFGKCYRRSKPLVKIYELSHPGDINRTRAQCASHVVSKLSRFKDAAVIPVMM